MNSKTIRRIKRIAIPLALLGAGAALQFAAVKYVDGGTVYQATHEAGVQDRVTVRGGVIRVGPAAGRDATAYAAARVKIPNTGIYLHDNATHASIGIRALTWAPDHCSIYIYTDAVDATDEIVAAVAEEDESISRLGIQAGISGGGGRSTLFFYRYDGRKVCATDKRFGSVSNVWTLLTYLAD